MGLEEKSIGEKYKYLRDSVYENVYESFSGKLNISTYYARRTAELLGGDYDTLTKLQKADLKHDIVFELVFVEKGILQYLK